MSRPAYDYAQNGAYVVTICTHDRARLLGSRNDGSVALNEVGAMVQARWDALPDRFPGVLIDARIVLPDHVHGILSLRESEVPLSRIVGAFKLLTVKAYKENKQWAPHAPILWQRNYYEHIIRSERALEQIREYITYNAAKGESFSP